MSEHPEQSDYLLERFDAWLKVNPVTPDKAFLTSLRSRLQRTPDVLEETMDDLLRPDPHLSDPHMNLKVRQRLELAAPSSKPAPWFQWLRPLAAAAVLTFAFLAFQTQAPDTPASLATNSPSPPIIPETQGSDADLTQIFALAANLHAPADVSSLQSVDNLAYLFE